jgi:hypothetical protein
MNEGEMNSERCKEGRWKFGIERNKIMVGSGMEVGGSVISNQ